MVIHVLSVASVSMSVESGNESHVSLHEAQINRKRHVPENKGQWEMHISLNGSIVYHYGQVVKAVMTKYWHFSHFIRKSE